MTKILAKSEPPISLKQHIQDGLSVWVHLQRCFPSASSCAKKENFWRLLWLCIIMHDLGKSHAEFQKVLKGMDNEWYSQRHELFSLPFVKSLKIPDKEKMLILRVVAAHHRSYDWLSDFIANNYEEDPSDFIKEFSKVNVEGAVALVNNFESDLLLEKINPYSSIDVIEEYQKEVRQVSIGKKEKIADYEALLMLMGAFHHCDHLSSAFITEFVNLKEDSFIFLENLKTELGKKGQSLYFHQLAASKSHNNVLLTAPTGSGKTETAIFWLKNQLKNNGQGRAFYVLPFTASINAMYERLSSDVKGLGKNMVGMLHGKLDAYLYESFFEESGNLKEIKSSIKEVKQTFKNLQTPLKVLTPFQLLKHLFGLKGFEKGIFEWVGGHFIFDEIHAYDPEVTAQIIVLLELLSSRLHAKIFIMTATMPTFLKKIVGKAISQYEEIRASSNLYESFQRHRLILSEGKLKENFQMIKDDLIKEKKVLVVCNTVDEARRVFEKLKSNFEALLIHGRFTAKDRTQIEKELNDKPPQLLIGTQAIEVSLDIDYDVIYTEPAPLDALVQRFGRVNRKRGKEPCPCIVFRERNEKDKYIYGDTIIEKSIEALEEITKQNGGIIKEVDLQKYIDQVYPGYDKESQKKFDHIYSLLSESVKRLTPFKPSPEGEEAYYRQFDGVKVLPAFYEKEFKGRLDQFDFIGAEQLKLSIRKNWFARLMNTACLEKMKHYIFPSNDPRKKGIEVKYYKINKYYSQKTGLNLEVDIENNAENISNNQFL